MCLALGGCGLCVYYVACRVRVMLSPVIFYVFSISFVYYVLCFLLCCGLYVNAVICGVCVPCMVCSGLRVCTLCCGLLYLWVKLNTLF